MTNCDLCCAGIKNAKPRVLNKDGCLEDVRGNKLSGRIFCKDNLEMLLDGELSMCIPCAHALIDEYAGLPF